MRKEKWRVAYEGRGEEGREKRETKAKKAT
jgi:hypothetical protein